MKPPGKKCFVSIIFEVTMRSRSCVFALFALTSIWATPISASEVNRYVKYKNIQIPVRVQPTGVCIYTKPNYGTERTCFTDSQSILDSTFNDNVESISMSSEYFAIAHEDTNYAGSQTNYLSNASDLGAAANTASSIQIELNDEDSDGVHYLSDTCPGTGVGHSVDANGCSDYQNDTDNDGVVDAYDICGTTASGESVDIQGCSDNDDSDGDGIANHADPYPHQSSTQCTP